VRRDWTASMGRYVQAPFRLAPLPWPSTTGPYHSSAGARAD
jgi:hypothetical protein